MGYGTIAADRITGTNGNSFSPESSVFRNRIINGAMTIDQRNAGASVTANNATFGVDRWATETSEASKLSMQQDAGAVTPPVGFTDYLGLTSSSAYTVTSGQTFNLYQRIEGLNIADLAWGTANAKTVTLSFWVRSSLTGTFGGAIQNNGNDRSYPFAFTISAANTWEQKSVTIAGDTSGTWLTTNGIGIRVRFSLGAGSSISGTAGAWSSSDFRSATGAVSVVGTNGATFYITGVQLEVGSTATSFDYRPYGTELALCQRYLPAWSGSSGNQDFCSAFNQTTTSTNFSLAHQVTTRVPPTGVVASGSLFFIGSNNAYAVSSVAFVGSSTQVTRLSGTISGGVANAAGNGFGQGTWLVYLTGCEL
jgi:hypothetical protein